MDDNSKKQSFSDEIKEHLLKNDPKPVCCRNSFICGVRLFRRSRRNKYTDAAEALCERLSERSGRKKKNSFFDDNTGVLGYVASTDQATRALDISGKHCPHCAENLLSGVFLSAGRAGDSKSNLYLEMVMPSETAADQISAILGEHISPPKRTVRRGELLLYYKKTGSIEDFLALIGALTSSFRLINEKIYTEFLINANRQKNCDTSNIQRTLGAASRQVAAIKALESAELLEELSAELRLTAAIRAENPYASLDELIALHPEPISRSGIQHRLRTLIKHAVKRGVLDS